MARANERFEQLIKEIDDKQSDIRKIKRDINLVRGRLWTLELDLQGLREEVGKALRDNVEREVDGLSFNFAEKARVAENTDFYTPVNKKSKLSGDDEWNWYSPADKQSVRSSGTRTTVCAQLTICSVRPPKTAK